MARLEIVQLPVLSDNYVYLLFSDSVTAVVDPAVAGPVMAELETRGRKLDFILNTHHHADHVGGNRELVARYGCKVVGPKRDAGRIPGIGIEVGDGDAFLLGTRSALVFDTPGHTRGHIIYYFADDNALFCGDTLFSMGCGRLFEGTPAEMWTSLKKLRGLPDETKVYCAHEYTSANVRFALSVDPENLDLKEYATKVATLRAQGLPTIPSRLGDEKRCNPFLRADEQEFATMGDTPVSVFAAIRRAKDSFR